MTTARLVLRCVLAHAAGLGAWFFFVLSHPAFAAPSDILEGVCTSPPYAHGQAYAGDCAAYSYRSVSVAELIPGMAVIGAVNWEWRWFNVGEMDGTEPVMLAGGELVLWSEIGYSGGGDPDPDPDPEPDPPGGEFGLDDLDMEEVLRAFSAGFFLVAMFWGFGKGIALILAQVRRG